MAEEEKKEEKEEKKGPGSIIKWIAVVSVVVILGAAGFVGWKYYKTHHSSSTKSDVEQTVQKMIIWPMGCLIVNLMDDNGQRYLKTTIQIEVAGQDCISELDLLKPKIMDGILDLLSSKTYREIVGFDGKQRLRDEIAVRLNSYLSKCQIRRVYFTEFLIQ